MEKTRARTRATHWGPLMDSDHGRMKGLARYLYCLAKYTTKAKADSEDVIEACKKQRSRLLEHDHCT
jgi:hypothetical protein